MLAEGLFLAVAQIAVTLAGFSGLVVAIRGAPSTAWHPRDIWSLSWMFGTSLGSLFLALLPPLLVFFFSERLVWTVASLVMCAFMFTFGVTMAVWSRRLTGRGHRPRVRYFPMAATVLLLLCGLLSGLAGVGLLVQVKVGVFVFGLIACLLVSSLSLVVFLVLLARSAGVRS